MPAQHHNYCTAINYNNNGAADYHHYIYIADNYHNGTADYYNNYDKLYLFDISHK
jgi:hypothetical protein